MGEKMVFVSIWLESRKNRKFSGVQIFPLWAHWNIFLPNKRENWRERENLDTIVPPRYFFDFFFAFFFIFFFLGLFVDPFFFFLILFLSICLLVCVDHFFVFGFCLTGRGTCFPFSSFFGWVFFPSSFFSLSFLV